MKYTRPPARPSTSAAARRRRSRRSATAPTSRARERAAVVSAPPTATSRISPCASPISSAPSRFYRDGLGLRQLFDVRLDGPGLDAVTGAKGARGRMIGLLVPGSGKVSIELIHFEHPQLSPPPRGRFTGWGNISLSVADIDATHADFLSRGLAPLSPPVEVGGVRMFFLDRSRRCADRDHRVLERPHDERGLERRLARLGPAVEGSRQRVRRIGAGSRRGLRARGEDAVATRPCGRSRRRRSAWRSRADRRGEHLVLLEQHVGRGNFGRARDSRDLRFQRPGRLGARAGSGARRRRCVEVAAERLGHVDPARDRRERIAPQLVHHRLAERGIRRREIDEAAQAGGQSRGDVGDRDPGERVADQDDVREPRVLDVADDRVDVVREANLFLGLSAAIRSPWPGRSTASTRSTRGSRSSSGRTRSQHQAPWAPP